MGIVRVLIASATIWAVPFLVSMPFFGRDGELITSIWLFKGTMIVVLAGTAVAAFRWLYATWPEPSLSIGGFVLIGVATVAVQVLLDLPTVIRMQQMSAGRYILEVGIVYAILIVVSTVIGFASQQGV